MCACVRACLRVRVCVRACVCVFQKADHSPERSAGGEGVAGLCAGPAALTVRLYENRLLRLWLLPLLLRGSASQVRGHRRRL